MREEEERGKRERQEEARAELDLRLHLHQPRLARISRDIYGLREGEGVCMEQYVVIVLVVCVCVCVTAELVAHRDRLSRHAKAVVTSISDIKAQALRAPEHMKTQVLARDNLTVM